MEWFIIIQQSQWQYQSQLMKICIKFPLTSLLPSPK
uniref:Uncharacterized protein n=1 Tax=Cucumis melo TaxID=3656 RepID=A0A9I9CBZ8_CUCME